MQTLETLVMEPQQLAAELNAVEAAEEAALKGELLFKSVENPRL